MNNKNLAEVVEISKFNNFTDDELYMLKRQAMESSFEIMMGDGYSEHEQKIHEKLLNDITKEDTNRNIYSNNKTTQDHISYKSYDEVPEGWLDRCSGDGYKKYRNGEGEWVYEDIEMSVNGIRPCARCGKYPGNDRGDDACISNLGEVMNACCGHGKNEGYIQFDNGITIRGYFKVDRHNFVK